MDTLHDAAEDTDLGMIITTGAVYGIFLVFGNSWSEFLKVAIIAVAPSHNNEIVGAFIYALSASLISVLSLLAVVKTNKCMKKHVNTSNIRTQSRKLKMYLSKRSRTDVAAGK